MAEKEVYIGNQEAHFAPSDIGGEFLFMDNEWFYKIENVDGMRPFFMTISSPDNHWMFLSSNGGISAGRGNADHALFPYYTHDKIIENADFTGNKTIVRASKDEVTWLWEPLSSRGQGAYHIQRNLYKNKTGNRLIFEEINHTLGLVYSCEWTNSKKYGVVKRARIHSNHSELYSINILDGLENLLPSEIDSALQSGRSNLVDGYRQNEQIEESCLGVYSLGSRIVDRAEPSECLRATVAWSAGLDVDSVLLSTVQLDEFRRLGKVENELLRNAEKSAYFIQSTFDLQNNQEKIWIVVGDVSLSVSEVSNLSQMISSEVDMMSAVNEEVSLSREALVRLVGSADGLQKLHNKHTEARHFNNVLFNIMRGGVFKQGYRVKVKHLKRHLAIFDKEVLNRNQSFLDGLGESILMYELTVQCVQTGDPDLIRLCTQYLPLFFSRRHGDPSRPWNQFSILQQDNNDEISGGYEGNWRDIFQNWEALAYSFPHFVQGMIFKFLNSSTIDGYNPYRITDAGVDWEVIEPDDPWSYIGYWGDHQIVYLTKLLEHCDDHHPAYLPEILNREWFVYVNVPYRISTYDEILKSPSSTVHFDTEVAEEIKLKVDKIGEDGKLVQVEGKSVKATLAEKLLLPLLTKLSNFVPDGGIWLNTQRPEWNDANNALVGNGLSMVTVGQIRRYINVIHRMFSNSQAEEIRLRTSVVEFYSTLLEAFSSHDSQILNGFNSVSRKSMMDALGWAGSKYRESEYSSASLQFDSIKKEEFLKALAVFGEAIDQTIRNNIREDHLMESYNLLGYDDNEATVDHLYIMLEGQVSLLSSGILTVEESKNLLSSLRSSSLYREDQRSFMLYPKRQLPSFLNKNNIPKNRVESSKLLMKLIEDGNSELVEKDKSGLVHFQSELYNANAVRSRLSQLEANSSYSALVQDERKLVLSIYEEVFNHKHFTGRSGTFFAFEGIGSIYWHMVSKLELAILEQMRDHQQTDSNECVDLKQWSEEVKEGIGASKNPAEYGGFPMDPYSHTPEHRGAQQPGMTGQVKEDILSRWIELGVFVKEGRISFHPFQFSMSEFLEQDSEFEYVDVQDELRSILVKEDSLAFSYLSVPVIYQMGGQEQVDVYLKDDTVENISSNQLTLEWSASLFRREGKVKKLIVTLSNERFVE